VALRNQVIAITEITGAIATADLVQIVDHVLQDQKVKTEVLDQSAGRDRKDKTEDHVLQDQKARVVGRDQSADQDRKDKTEDHVLQDQKARTACQGLSEGRDLKGKTVQTELLL
jgi:hypothetical protein